MTYGDLVAAADRRRPISGGKRYGRFAILDHDASTVVALLAGASIAGAEPCVYPPTDDGAVLGELAERFDHDGRRDRPEPDLTEQPGAGRSRRPAGPAARTTAERAGRAANRCSS